MTDPSSRLDAKYWWQTDRCVEVIAIVFDKSRLGARAFGCNYGAIPEALL